ISVTAEGKLGGCMDARSALRDELTQTLGAAPALDRTDAGGEQKRRRRTKVAHAFTWHRGFSLEWPTSTGVVSVRCGETLGDRGAVERWWMTATHKRAVLNLFGQQCGPHGLRVGDGSGG